MKPYKLTPRLKKWLLAIHILFIVAWMGGTLCMLTLILASGRASNLYELTTTTLNTDLLDKIFIQGPAIGSLITGLILSIYSNWGLTQYYWIIVKAVLTVAIILFGILGLNPWSRQTIQMIYASGWGVLNLPEYAFTHNMALYGALLNSILMGFMVILSSLKPWGRIRAR
jgi:uncharacterized membrane protein